MLIKYKDKSDIFIMGNLTYHERSKRQFLQKMQILSDIIIHSESLLKKISSCVEFR